MTTSLLRYLLIPTSAVLVLGLTACNKTQEAASTQVAAKVGTEEISVHQVNQVLQRLNPSDGSAQSMLAMKQGILEKLIDQELAVEQATAAKLHRSPEVLAQIEAARREVLVRAYMQKVGASQPKPTAEEIKKFHQEQPQLFTQRRIFTVQEILVPVAKGIEDQMRRFAASGRSIEDATEWLNSQRIKFNSGGATRAAEQIPLDLLTQLHGLKDGQSLVMSAQQVVTLVRVTSSEPAPISEADAYTRIEQYLMNKRMSEAVATNLKQLRTTTKIAYVGDFSNVSERAAVPAMTQPTSGQSVIEKGVAGMR
ncbi:MAG: peptidyl-prolyl cis-trans isomerase, EpsD family [Rhizobacter sp.]